MRGVRLAAVAAAVLLAPSVLADAPQLGLRLTCEPLLVPGRVRCELHLTAPPRHRVAWADALVREAPEFARPLRSRVRATREADGNAQAALALVATTTGSGTLTVQGRAVLCRADELADRECRPARGDVRVALRVGP